MKANQLQGKTDKIEASENTLKAKDGLLSASLFMKPDFAKPLGSVALHFYCEHFSGKPVFVTQTADLEANEDIIIAALVTLRDRLMERHGRKPPARRKV